MYVIVPSLTIVGKTVVNLSRYFDSKDGSYLAFWFLKFYFFMTQRVQRAKMHQLTKFRRYRSSSF